VQVVPAGATYPERGLALADTEGVYLVDSVDAPGAYDVIVSSPGYIAHTVAGLSLSPGNSALVNVNLDLDPAYSDTIPPTVALVKPQENETVTGAIPVVANAVDETHIDRVEFYLDTEWLGTATTNESVELGDAFNGSQLDPKWTWLNPPQSYDVGSTRPGWLHVVSHPDTDFTDSLDNGHLLFQETGGDFRLVAVASVAPSVEHQQIGLMVREDGDQWMKLVYAYQGGATVVQAFRKEDGICRLLASRTVAADPLYLRVHRAGEQIVGYYSTDGSNWLEVYAWSQPVFDPVKVGLVVCSGSNTNFPGDFDVFTAHLPEYYSHLWDTTSAPNGPHTLEARAYDLAGNSTDSVPVSVIVSN
jgi:regulation of enolase protein 1 (concanavalin A-like superfamily)